VWYSCNRNSAMIRKPHTDCFPTPAAATWQGQGTFM